MKTARNTQQIRKDKKKKIDQYIKQQRENKEILKNESNRVEKENDGDVDD